MVEPMMMHLRGRSEKTVVETGELQPGFEWVNFSAFFIELVSRLADGPTAMGNRQGDSERFSETT